MTRTFQDDNLLLWETYTAAPRAGEGHGARMMFHCLSATDRRARVLETGEDRTTIEKRIHDVSDDELAGFLARSQPLD